MNKRVKSLHMASLCLILLAQTASAATTNKSEIASNKAEKQVASAEGVHPDEGNFAQLVDKFLTFALNLIRTQPQ